MITTTEREVGTYHEIMALAKDEECRCNVKRDLHREHNATLLIFARSSRLRRAMATVAARLDAQVEEDRRLHRRFWGARQHAIYCKSLIARALAFGENPDPENLAYITPDVASETLAIGINDPAEVA